LTTTVGLRELRTKLSYYMRRVRAGERVTVTVRGVPVAVIVPVTAIKQAKERRRSS